MSSHLLMALFAVLWVTACGDESQSDRTGRGDLTTIEKKTNDAEQQSTGGSEETNDEDPEKLAKQLEEQGLTNGGSPLVAINLSQGAAIIPVGAQTFWLATGIYEDESERDLTELADWGSTNDDILEALTTDPGGVKGVAEGKANVTVKVGTTSTSAAMTIIP